MKSLLFHLLTLVLALSASAGQWTITTIAGDGQQGFSGDGGPATQAQLDNPFGLVRGPDGALYFCEYGGQRIRKLLPDGTIHTAAGVGRKGYDGDGGRAVLATFNQPSEIRFDRAGDLYIADMQNHAIRKITLKTGLISTIAGNGQPGYSGDGGLADQAQFNQPQGLQFAPDGTLYICDSGNNVIRQIDPKTGVITTFSGTGKPGETPDGASIEGTPLDGPRSLEVDKQGNPWVVTRGGNQLLKFDLKANKIVIAAGNGKKGFTGNGGPAIDATLSSPKGVAIDSVGNVWIADTESHSIRVVVPQTGTIELAAGTGEKGDGPDGVPVHCQLARPHGIFIDVDGAVYIGDSESHRIRVLRFK